MFLEKLRSHHHGLMTYSCTLFIQKSSLLHIYQGESEGTLEALLCDIR